jgi:acetylornithine deacetylase/succinyl-diaminopimelate desuccinylase-like protein
MAMTEETKGRLEAAVEAGIEGALAELALLCAIPSVSAKGEGQEECARLVVDQMRARGLEAQVMPVSGGPPVAYGEYRAADPDAPTVLFYNHYDVQPCTP